ncbi:MAG: hypothetical protein V3W20_09095 [Candidatus Neomarinimicrobiota bacterium]
MRKQENNLTNEVEESIFNENRDEVEDQYNYRQDQLAKIDDHSDRYSTKIKVVSENDETKWLDITDAEVKEIKQILVRRQKNVTNT